MKLLQLSRKREMAKTKANNYLQCLIIGSACKDVILLAQIVTNLVQHLVNKVKANLQFCSCLNMATSSDDKQLHLFSSWSAHIIQLIIQQTCGLLCLEATELHVMNCLVMPHCYVCQSQTFMASRSQLYIYAVSFIGCMYCMLQFPEPSSRSVLQSLCFAPCRVHCLYEICLYGSLSVDLFVNLQSVLCLSASLSVQLSNHLFVCLSIVYFLMQISILLICDAIAGSNVQSAFSAMREYQPHGPLVRSTILQSSFPYKQRELR